MSAIREATRRGRAVTLLPGAQHRMEREFKPLVKDRNVKKTREKERRPRTIMTFLGLLGPYI